MLGRNPIAAERAKTKGSSRGRKMVRKVPAHGPQDPGVAGHSSPLAGAFYPGRTSHPGRSRPSAGASTSGSSVRVRYNQDTLRTLLGARFGSSVSSMIPGTVRHRDVCDY